MNSFVTYLKNVRGELAHVVWPKRNTAIFHTVLVILISALIAIAIAALDYFFTGVLDRALFGL